MGGKGDEWNYQRIYWLLTHLGEGDLTAFAIGGSSLFIFLATKFIKRRYPPTPERVQSPLFMLWYYVSSFTTLIVVVVATSVSYVLDKQGYTIKVLGEIPPGLPAPAMPALGKFSAGR